MTKPKMTPDELAHAVKDLIQSNGDVLTSLDFGTLHGEHHYKTLISNNLDGSRTSYFVW